MRLARRNFSQFKSALFVALLLALGLLPLIKGRSPPSVFHRPAPGRRIYMFRAPRRGGNI
jgi:hypothetical protein